jgi:two-component system nitrate/nitrite response regulator NarL
MAAETIDFTTAPRLQADPTSHMKPGFTTDLVCDTALLRSGLEHVLSGSPFVLTKTVVAAGPGLADNKTEQPALVIIAANRFSGLMAGAIQKVKEQFPQARIVALADQFDPDCVRKAYEAGTDGIFLTALSPQALVTSLELVMLGESMVPMALGWSMLNEQSSSPTPESQGEAVTPLPSDPRMHKLSPREAEILRCIMQGHPNKVIARKCDVTEATIKVHVKAILRKVGVSNRTQAAMWASERLPRTVGIPVNV